MSDPALLADGVVRLGTKYVNWYLVADEQGVTIVDAGVPRYRPQLEPGLELLGRSLEDVKAILLTHADGDHTGVSPKVRSETGAPIHLHPDDAESASKRGKKKIDESMNEALGHLEAWKLFGHFTVNGGARPPIIEDTVPVPGGSVDVPGQPVAIPTPGHTPGHVAYWFADHGALMVGDLMCTRNPVTGRVGPQVMAFNVSTPQSFDSLEAVDEIAADLLLPGHGEPWTEGVKSATGQARETAIADGRIPERRQSERNQST
jgi:glyoxylase-like metal-dependent hydrolase (beta-lactamase superfamily II)